MKVQLIRPPVDDWYTPTQLTDFFSAPTGLCLIASDLNHPTKILDGNLLTIDKILEKINGDIVGVSDIYSSHENSLKILKKAKEKGSITVLGGPHVNYLAERILKNNDFVDYVIVGDGEESFPKLVNGESLDKIPNLVYRKDNKIIRNKREYVRLNHLFDLENLENLDYYLKKPASLSLIRGCIKAEKKERCSFCSMDNKLKLMDPDLAWHQIRILYEKYGIDLFMEAGDTFFVGNYPEKLLNARPNDLEFIITKKVFARPDEINDKNIEILKALNVEYVFIGIETMNDRLLRIANKGYYVNDIKNAINLARNSGVKLHVPFIYGLSGETRETAERNYEFAKHLVESFSGIKIISSTAVPLPGSELFQQLMFNPNSIKDYPGDIHNDDVLNYAALVKLQIKYNTQITFEYALEMVEKTKDLIEDDSFKTSFDINN